MTPDFKRPSGALARVSELSVFPLVNGALIAGYVIVYLFFRDALPEKWSVDSAKILSILGYGNGGSLDDSFAATAAFFSVIGRENLDLFTVCISSVYTVFATHGARTLRDFTLRWLLIMPCMMLNMFAPSKETIVLILTMMISAPVIFSRGSKLSIWVMLASLYLCYGLLVRKYYVLILGVFLLIYFISRQSRRVQIAASTLVLCGVLFSPSEVVMSLQSPRDTSNSYAEVVGSDNRTAFNNLVPPTNGLNFIVNYAYAAAVLLAPAISFHTLSDVVMQVVIITVLMLLFKARKRLRHSRDHSVTRFFAALFFSHILVQIIFEPDLGSFTRHLSSVFLYLIAMRAAEVKERFR